MSQGGLVTENSLNQNANGANVENPYIIHTMDGYSKKLRFWCSGFQICAE